MTTSSDNVVVVKGALIAPFKSLYLIMGCPTGFNFSGDRCICNEELLNLKTVVCNPQNKLIENMCTMWNV